MKQIPLANSDRFALVDDEDYPLLSRHSWILTDHGYARTSSKGGSRTNKSEIYMHMLVVGDMAKGPIVTDHKDRNGLNNQKENLRAATRQQNSSNRDKSRNNTSGYKGVHFRSDLKSRPWMASVTKTENGVQKTHYLGYFETAERAALAYNKKSLELFGPYAVCNVVREREHGCPKTE